MVYLVECLEENWGEIYVLTNRKLCQYSIDELRKQINDRSVLTLIGQCFKKKMNSHLRRLKNFKNCVIAVSDSIQNTALFSTFLRPPSVRPFVTGVTSQLSSII